MLIGKSATEILRNVNAKRAIKLLDLVRELRACPTILLGGDKYPSCYLNDRSWYQYYHYYYFYSIKNDLFPLSRPLQELNKNPQQPKRKVGVLGFLSYLISRCSGKHRLRAISPSYAFFVPIVCAATPQIMITSYIYL